MTRRLFALGLLPLLALVVVSAQQAVAPVSPVFPARGVWPASPETVGFNRTRLDEAVAFAVANENTNTRDLAVDIPNSFRSEAPYNTLVGPTQPRAEANGVIVRRGRVAAAWGDTDRVDMTFSVTKTFLSTVVGLAVERGLIRNVTDRVAPYMPSGVDLFTSEHNAKITWEDLLRQSSDWSGTLWDKPDWADRPPRGQTPEQWAKRPMVEPGTADEYNDTRVNVLSLATLHLFKQPLPDVLKATIMDPIGASSTWHWEAYDNARVTIGGKTMGSVPGGRHHGGGMFISAWDLARFGYLFLRNGQWQGRELVSPRWIAMARTPGPANATYGYMNWFLNTDRKPFPSTPATSVTFQGNGQNIVYIDWDNDLVVVVRWLGGGTRALDQFLGKVLAAIAP